MLIFEPFEPQSAMVRGAFDLCKAFRHALPALSRIDESSFSMTPKILRKYILNLISQKNFNGEIIPSKVSSSDCPAAEVKVPSFNCRIYSSHLS